MTAKTWAWYIIFFLPPLAVLTINPKLESYMPLLGDTCSRTTAQGTVQPSDAWMHVFLPWML